MGFALAEVAAKMGAEVFLIAGPVALDTPKIDVNQTTKLYNIKRIDVVSAQEMYEATLNYYKECDILIFSAAVADFTPKITHSGKIKKDSQSLQNIELIETIDIIKTISSIKLENQIIVGFALESENLNNYAEKKLLTKNADFIIGNYANKENSGFGGDNNTITIYTKKSAPKNFPPMSKFKCAEVLLQEIIL